MLTYIYIYIIHVIISRPELKIRREVLDCSAYHAAAAAAVPRLRLNISVAIDFQNRKFGIYGEKVFFKFSPPRPTRLIVLIVN